MNRTSLDFFKEKGYFDYPQMMQFEITLRCPFNCRQCYKKTIKKKDIEYDFLISMIDSAVRNNVKIITLNGGEPLMFPRIVELMEHIGEKSIYTNIFSSGFGLTDEIVEELKKNKNIHFFISLNGSTKEINDCSREGYEISLDAIRHLGQEEVEFGVNWVARHDNIYDFPKLLELCKTYGASTVSITSNKLTGQETIQSPLTREDIKVLVDGINLRRDLQPRIMIESCFSMLSCMLKANKNKFSAHCYAGISNCTVNCDGSFQPCTHLKYPEFYDSLEEYWSNSKKLKELRENPPYKLEPCISCKNSTICSLCRAMSSETYRDFKEGMHNCVSYLE